MVVVPNLHHIRIHFVQRLSLRIFDEQHIVVCCNRPSLRTINVNELDAIIAQSIQLHHLNILMEIVDLQAVHLQVLFSMVPDIMRALNLFAIAEIIPKLTENKRDINNLNLINFYGKRTTKKNGAKKYHIISSIFERSYNDLKK